MISSGVGIFLLFGTGAFGETWTPPITFLLAAAIYATALEFSRRRWFVLERPNDPRLEVDDPWEDRVRCGFCDRSYIAYEIDRDPGSGHRPICAECASTSSSLYRDAKSEAEQASRKQDSAVPLSSDP